MPPFPDCFIKFWADSPQPESRRCSKKEHASLVREVVDAWFYTFLLSRNKDPEYWDLPLEQQLLQELIDSTRLLYQLMEERPIWTIEFLKELSFEARRSWMENQMLDGMKTIFHKIANMDLKTFGYLGRALPCQPKFIRDQKRKEAIDRFLTPMIQPEGRNLIRAAGNRILKWSEQVSADAALESPPYSESASLITSRKIGGQARIWRDMLRVLSIISREQSTTEEQLFGYNDMIPMGIDPLTGDESYLSYYGQSTEAEKRYETTSNILQLIHWLDYPYLLHIANCLPDKTCDHPEYHYPFQLKSIPESGWRTRCASLPWPSLIYATELPRREIMRGAKRDRTAGPALGNFRGVEKVVDRHYVNSCDLLSATDYFSLYLQHELTQKIARKWTGTIFYDFIIASGNRSRIVEDDYKFEDWPGIDYFIDQCCYPKHTTISEIASEYHTNNEDRGRLEKMLIGIGFKRSDLQQPATIPIRRTPCHTRAIGHGTKVEELAYRIHGDVRKNGRSYVANVESAFKLEQKRSKHDSFLRQPGKAKEILLAMRDWYRKQFEAAPGKLSVKGQHMSLPLSWVILSAINTTAITESQVKDDSLIAYTMGDDAIIGANRIETIERYRRNMTRMGCVINLKKDMISDCHRGVFCEYLFDQTETKTNGWVDIPRPKLITQPNPDPYSCRWTCIKDGVSKYYTEISKLILRKCRIAKYEEYISKAVKYGYDPSVPPEFGGLGLINWKNENQMFTRRCLNHLKNFSPEKLIKFDHDLQRTTSISPPFTYSAILMSGIKEGMEYGLKSKGAGWHTTSEASSLIIEEYLPGLIYQPNFEREKIYSLDPKTIGKRFRRALFNIRWEGGASQEVISDSELYALAKLRHEIRVRSPLLEELRTIRTEKNRFWI